MRIQLSIFLFVLPVFIACNSNDQGSQNFKSYLKTHEYAVGQSNFTIVDSLRNRPIKTEIWYPTKDTSRFNISTEYPFILPPTSQNADLISGKFPLILLSHGTGGNRIGLMWLACELASSGYIVIGIDHYGNTMDNKIPENFVKVWDRPLDISFTIDHILNDPKFNSIIDSNRIGMAGFSLGGYTSIALAGGELEYGLLKEFSKTEEGKIEFTLPELGDVSKFITPEIINRGNATFKNLKDDRITAFISMAPAIGQGFQRKEQFEKVNNPILIIGAEKDKRTPNETNASHYHRLIKNSDFIDLKGNIGHYIFLNEAKSELKRGEPVIFKDDKTINRKEEHKKIAKIIIDFFEIQLKEKSH